MHITNAGGFGRVQFGGAERAVEELSSALAADPLWTVNVAAPSEYLSRGRFGDRVRLWSVEPTDFSPRRLFLPRARIRMLLRRIDPDVVLLHLLRSTLVGLPAARIETSAATISILHNSLHDSRSATGGRRLRDATNMAAFRTIGRLASAHVAIGESNARDLVAKDGQQPDRVHLINNWVSKEFTASDVANRADVRQALDVNADAPLIVVPGRLESQKRQDRVIEALPRLPGVTLGILGEGSLAGRYAELAERLTVSDRVRFLGFRRDVADVIGAADVVAVPSAFEGFGRVAVEAIAIGTPVVLSRVAGLEDAVRGAPVGAATLVEPDDSSSWVAALAGALGTDPGAELRRAMRRWARDRYSLESRVGAYRELIEQVATDQKSNC